MEQKTSVLGTLLETLMAFVFLNGLWFMTLFGGITFIPGSVVMLRMIRSWHETKIIDANLFKDFFREFKLAWKEGWRLSLFFVGMLVLLLVDLLLSLTFGGGFGEIITILSLVGLFMLFLWTPMCIWQLANVQLDWKNHMKNSFFLIWIEWKRVALFIVGFGLITVCVGLFPLLLIGYGSYVGLLTYILFVPIIQRVKA